MLNTLIAQVLENLIKYHHFNLITVQNLDTCYLKAAKRLDLIGFDNSTCWYFPFKLHITISILHSWATSFSCLFYFFFIGGCYYFSFWNQVPLPLLVFHYYWFLRSKHHRIMHEWIARLQIVVFPILGCETLSVHTANLCDHQIHVLAWTGVDCICTWHNLMICLLDQKGAKKYFLFCVAESCVTYTRKLRSLFLVCSVSVGWW